MISSTFGFLVWVVALQYAFIHLRFKLERIVFTFRLVKSDLFSSSGENVSSLVLGCTELRNRGNDPEHEIRRRRASVSVMHLGRLPIPILSASFASLMDVSYVPDPRKSSTSPRTCLVGRVQKQIRASKPPQGILVLLRTMEEAIHAFACTWKDRIRSYPSGCPFADDRSGFRGRRNRW